MRRSETEEYEGVRKGATHNGRIGLKKREDDTDVIHGAEKGLGECQGY